MTRFALGDVMPKPLDLKRRLALHAAVGAGLIRPWATLSFAAAPVAAAGANRFVMVILRGGLDGLSAVPAIGDPDFAAARGALAQFAAPPLALDARFALHPHLAELHAMYGRGELLVVHAVGLPYRERSHFDAQQVLESGGDKPYQIGTGWLARALLGSSGAAGAKGLALNTSVPLVLRGNANVDTWAPSALPEPSADLITRLERLYAGDPALATALARAKALHLEGAMASDMSAAPGPRGANFTLLAQRCAEFLAQANGPQAAVLELGGWDTHVNQVNPNGALANNLRVLDTGLAALRDGLLTGGVWKTSVVVVATEFGREVAINGTQGTDHGSAGVAFVLGGAVKGARVVTDWPGLAKGNRFEGRDLRTTTDLRAVLKGALGPHWHLAEARLNDDVFPGSTAIKALDVLR
jgi:uncharacterized protein (DUF1501 family)